MGKKMKTRLCPALGGTLASTECGRRRHRDLACPELCPFNPFTLEQTASLRERELRLHSTIAYAWLQSQGEQAVRQATADFPDAPYRILEVNERLFRALYQERGPDGRSFLETWLAEHGAGLSNDDRRLLEGCQAYRFCLLEVITVEAGGLLRMRDHFTEEPTELVLVEPLLSKTAVPDQLVLGWFYPLPHFWRAVGPMVDVRPGQQQGLTAWELLEAVIRHLGAPGPSSGPAVNRAWLVEHYAEVAEQFGKSQQRVQFGRLLASVEDWEEPDESFWDPEWKAQDFPMPTRMLTPEEAADVLQRVVAGVNSEALIEAWGESLPCELRFEIECLVDRLGSPLAERVNETLARQWGMLGGLQFQGLLLMDEILVQTRFEQTRFDLSGMEKDGDFAQKWEPWLADCTQPHVIRALIDEFQRSRPRQGVSEGKFSQAQTFVLAWMIALDPETTSCLADACSPERSD